MSSENIENLISFGFPRPLQGPSLDFNLCPPFQQRLTTYLIAVLPKFRSSLFLLLIGSKRDGLCMPTLDHLWATHGVVDEHFHRLHIQPDWNVFRILEAV